MPKRNNPGSIVMATTFPTNRQYRRRTKRLRHQRLLFRAQEVPYGAEYSIRVDNLSLSEVGKYDVVAYAEDDDGLIARPKKIVLQTGWELYLPMVIR